MKIIMTAISETQRARLYLQEQKKRNVLIYKKQDTFQKQDNFVMSVYTKIKAL